MQVNAPISEYFESFPWKGPRCPVLHNGLLWLLSRVPVLTQGSHTFGLLGFGVAPGVVKCNEGVKERICPDPRCAQVPEASSLISEKYIL